MTIIVVDKINLEAVVALCKVQMQAVDFDSCTKVTGVLINTSSVSMV